MALEFPCVNCDLLIRVPADAAGQRVKCPQCAAVQYAPGAQAPMAEPPKGARPERIDRGDGGEELFLADIPEADLDVVPDEPKQPPARQPKPSTLPVAQFAPVKPKAAQAPPAQQPTANRPKPPAAQSPQAPSPQPAAPLSALDDFLSDELMAGPAIQVETPVWVEPLPSGPAPPSRGYGRRRRRTDSSGILLLKVPALVIALWSIIAICLIVARDSFFCYNLYKVWDYLDDQTMPQVTVNIIISAIVTLILLIVNGMILRGGLCMISGKDYSTAKTGAILSAIPICGLLSFPFGIWAWILLSNPDVEDQFED